MEDEKKIEPVIKGNKAKKQKPSFGKKFSDIFLAESVEDTKSYIFFDVLVPAFKDMIVDAGKSFIDSMFYGADGVSRHNRSRLGTNSKTSYTKYYRGDSGSRVSSYDDDRKSSRSSNKRERYSYDEVVFDDRGDAERVLDCMIDYLETYKFVTVSDFYQFCNMPDEHTDRNWGWDDLSSARTERVQGGYIIKLPKVISA